jgi:hypothetical protein
MFQALCGRIEGQVARGGGLPKTRRRLEKAVYLEQAAAALERQRTPIPPECLPHLSPPAKSSARQPVMASVGLNVIKMIQPPTVEGLPFPYATWSAFHRGKFCDDRGPQ